MKKQLTVCKILAQLKLNKKKKGIRKGAYKVRKWLSGNVQIPRMAVAFGLLGSLLFLIIPQFFAKPIKPQPEIPQINKAFPVAIEINRLGINLPVKEATVSANDWQVYDDAVSWLSGSGDLRGGNIVLYGHNAKTIFGSIIKLSLGDQITLKGKGMDRTYIVEKSYQTSRWDLSAVTSSNDQLTMYTCSGWFDANRWFVIAKPLSLPH